MTVDDLITELQKLPSDRQVVLSLETNDGNMFYGHAVAAEACLFDEYDDTNAVHAVHGEGGDKPTAVNRGLTRVDGVHIWGEALSSL